MRTTALIAVVCALIAADTGARAQSSGPDTSTVSRLPSDSTFEEFMASTGPLAHRQNLAPLAVGAIAGVVMFNFATTIVAPPAIAGVAVTESALALSRLYAVVSAVLGAWGANWVYENVYEKVGMR